MNRLIGFVFLLAISLSCNSETVDTELIQSIPDDSKIVIALDEVKQIEDFLENNPLFDQLESLSRIQEIKNTSSFLTNYDLKSESFVALSMEGKNKVAITLLTDALPGQLDSTVTIKKINYNEVEISENTFKGSTYYSATKNGTHMASSSILVLESLIRRELENYVFDDSFVTLYDRTHHDFSVYMRATDEQWLYQFLLGKNKTDSNNYAEWYQLELSMDGKSVSMDGLIIYKDSIKQKQAIHNNLTARENQVDKFVPASFLSVSSTTYTDAEQLMNNLQSFKGNNVSIPVFLNEVLNNAQEISNIELENGTAIGFTLLPYDTFFTDLDSLSAAKTTYRDQSIYTMVDPFKSNGLSPLVAETTLTTIVLVDNFLIMSDQQEALEEIIANYQNGTTLSAQNWWQQTSEKMSTSSTLLNITSLKKLKKPFILIDDKDQKTLDKVDENSIKAIVSQYVHEDGYAFYRMEIPYARTIGEQPLVAQVGSFKPESKIIAGPFLFPNHLNNTYDVAVQTEDFKLTLASETGTVHWSKELDAIILGDINAIDAYKNGRQQLLFTTSKKAYLLDRNGNDVDKFPYNPKREITQPISVFDYDNNRNYRIIVTTGKDLKMLDSKGNTVSGFKYSKNGNILNSPQHFRINNKDYIAFTTDQRKLMLLSRNGSVRTNVKDKIEIRGKLNLNNDLIKFVTTSNKLLHVNPTTGKVSTTKISLDADSYVAFTSRSQLIQNKSVLQINGNKKTLPYGSYLPAQLTLVNNKEYITVVDDGENKVYILNNQGDVLPFLPVYGSSKAAIDGGKSRYLVTLDGNDVLIYKW